MCSFVRSLVAAPLLLTLAGCDVFGPEDCTTELRYGVVVEAIHGDTGEPVTEGLAGTLRDGSYSESMEVFGNVLQGAPERAGRYTLEVRATGFETVTGDDIIVTEGDCHVSQVNLQAEMDPVAAAVAGR